MSIASLGQTLLISGCALLAFAILYFIAARMPRATIVLFLMLVTLTTGSIGFYPSASLLGASIYPADVFTLIFLSFGIFRQLSNGHWSKLNITAGLLTVLVGCGLLSWFILDDLQTAVNHWRTLLLSLGVFWWATAQSQWSSRLLAPVVWVALAGATIQTGLYLVHGFGSASDGHWQEGIGWVSARPLEASGALIMLCGLLLLIYRPGPWRPFRVAAIAYLAVSVVLCQHRSVWVAALVAGLFALVMVLKARKLSSFLLVPAVALGAPLTIWTVSLLANSSELESSATNTGTLDARFSFWSERMAVARTTTQWLFGEVFGPTPISTDPRFTIEAHSMYIQIITTLGIVGLILLLALLTLSIRLLVFKTGQVHSVLFPAIIVFGFFYIWPAWSFMLLAQGRGPDPEAPSTIDITSSAANSMAAVDSTRVREWAT